MMTRVSKKDEINSGLRAVLKHPAIYNFFGKMMGLQAKYRMYVDQFIKPYQNMRILDIGCGTASILEFLPLYIEYTGYDINTEYIKYAKKKYIDRTCFFYNQRVNDMTLSHQNPFTVILTDSLIHHLNDCEAKSLFDLGYRALKKNGLMLTVDPAYIENQKTIDRLITSADRGRHIRYPKEYKKIAESNFHQIDIFVVPDIGFFSLTACILKCKK